AYSRNTDITLHNKGKCSSDVADVITRTKEWLGVVPTTESAFLFQIVASAGVKRSLAPPGLTEEFVAGSSPGLPGYIMASITGTCSS
ncbi:MAG: hypothetical protein AABZ47_11285, partial [Planctomycetota bacterium]